MQVLGQDQQRLLASVMEKPGLQRLEQQPSTRRWREVGGSRPNAECLLQNLQRGSFMKADRPHELGERPELGTTVAIDLPV